MKYSSLIRKLLNASMDARWQEKDVAERLKERSTDDTDLIRQMLMNAVCDPRIKMHVNGYPSWRSLAEKHLESFAESLQAIPNLNENEALHRLDEMLDAWMRRSIEVDRSYNDEKLGYNLLKGHDSADIQRIRRALDELLMEETDEKEFIPISNQRHVSDDDLKLGWDIMKPRPKKPKKDGVGKDDSDENNAMLIYNPDGRELLDDDGVQPMFIGKGSERQKVLEDRFLTNVPPSLIKLAKIIGRSGDGIMSSSGSFPSASKSDIGGITIGNDLSSLLPTELALLAEPATQSVFYKNYATRRLQVFASTSHDTKGKKHRDGPIIICMDTSGSMKGEPVLVAKALTMAICIIAQRNRRPVLVVRYSDDHELFRLHNIGVEKKKILDFLSVVGAGGNDEDELFRWLFTDIMPNEGDYDSADVLCISDFGWIPVGKKSMDLIENEKQKGMSIYGLRVNQDKRASSYDFAFDSAKIIRGHYDSIIDSMWEYVNGEASKVR